jgi:hypothetical protein
MESNYLENMLEFARTQPDDIRIAVMAETLRAVVDNAKGGGSFRHFLYERLGLPPAAYTPLYLAGGMTVTNAFALPDVDGTNKLPGALVRLQKMAEGAPSEPPPDLKRASGEPFLLPSTKRETLFEAFQVAVELAESNAQLQEANRRLAERCERLESSHKS